MPYIERNAIITDSEKIYGKVSTFSETATSGVNGKLITASDVAIGDRFGSSVAIGQGVIAVGAYSEDTGQTSAGSLYLFDYEGNEKKIIRNPDTGTNFGTPVAIGCNIIVAGMVDDTTASNAGAVYLYTLGGDLITKLISPEGAIADDRFGRAIAVGNGRLVVGAETHSGDTYLQDGAVYIFDPKGNFIRKLTSPNPSNSGFFGVRLAVNCGRICVLDFKGGAYIYDLDGNLVATLSGIGTQNRCIGVNDGRVVVGDYLNDDAGGNAGCIHIFDLDGNSVAANVTASDAASGDQLGRDVAIGSGRIFAAAPLEDAEGTDAGAVYEFDLDGNQLSKMRPSPLATGDEFGNYINGHPGLAVGAGRLVVGASGDSSDRGQVYIFQNSTTYAPDQLANAPAKHVLDFL